MILKNKFEDMYVSTSAEITNIIRAMSKFEIYFLTAYFIFSLLLSLIMVLYILIPLIEMYKTIIKDKSRENIK